MFLSYVNCKIYEKVASVICFFIKRGLSIYHVNYYTSKTNYTLAKSYKTRKSFANMFIKLISICHGN